MVMRMVVSLITHLLSFVLFVLVLLLSILLMVSFIWVYGWCSSNSLRDCTFPKIWLLFISRLLQSLVIDVLYLSIILAVLQGFAEVVEFFKEGVSICVFLRIPLNLKDYLVYLLDVTFELSFLFFNLFLFFLTQAEV